MQRIQKSWRLLVGGALGLLVACNPTAKVMTTSEYLHDIDAARLQVQKGKTDPAKYMSDPATINASNALAAVSTSLGPYCWPKQSPISSATTDHACLDAKGFKR